MCPALITPRTEQSTKASTRGWLSFLGVSGGRTHPCRDHCRWFGFPFHMSIRIASPPKCTSPAKGGLHRGTRFNLHCEPYPAVCEAHLSARGNFWFWAVQDPVLNKSDALLTCQSFDYGPVARIFLKSGCSASIRIIHA